MKKILIKGITVIISLVMILTFVPMVGGQQLAYAGNGEDYDCDWVWGCMRDLIDITPIDSDGEELVAFPSLELYMDDRAVIEYLGYKEDEIDWIFAQWQYKAPGDETWTRFATTPVSYDVRQYVKVPEEAVNGQLRVCIHDEREGWYYYGWEVEVCDRDVGYLTSKGTKTITFDKSYVILKELPSYFLESSIKIAGYQGKIKLKVDEYGNYYIDVNKDGSNDFYLYMYEEDPGDGPDEYIVQPYIKALKTAAKYGSTEATFSVNKSGKFGEFYTDYEIRALTYYSKVVFKLPRKSIKNANITLNKTSFVYNGESQKPTATVKDGTKKLVKGTDYSVSGARKKVGKGTLTITGKGKYKDTRKFTFKVVPKGTSISSISPLYKGFKVVWKKQATETSGYQVCYANNADFKDKHIKTVSGSSMTSRSVTKLASKKYWVKVRTYKTVNGEKFYSKWSDVKTVSPRQ